MEKVAIRVTSIVKMAFSNRLAQGAGDAWLHLSLSLLLSRRQYLRISYILCDTTTPWAIKKGATFIFTITLANVDRFQ